LIGEFGILNQIVQVGDIGLMVPCHGDVPGCVRRLYYRIQRRVDS
jgi:hypothetical protein